MKPNDRQQIVWVTPDCFIDVDIDIIQSLENIFHIHWFVILPAKGSRYTEQDFAHLQSLNNLRIVFLYTKYRQRDPRNMLFFWNLSKRVKKIKSSLVYVDYVPTTPFELLFFLSLDPKKTIIAAHDGDVKASVKFNKIAEKIFFLAYGRFKYVHMFSVTEASRFQSSFTNHNVFLIPLIPKNYGATEVAKKRDVITFLFFGIIRKEKNLELLINAACELYEEGISGFEVVIAGACEEWDKYQKLIKYPEIFKCDIRKIENSDIPNLFGASHYMVFPYKQMSQSGAMKVAFAYKVPVIVPNLQGFLPARRRRSARRAPISTSPLRACRLATPAPPSRRRSEP